MTHEFEGELAGSVFWGADLSGSTFRDVNLTDITISHAWFVNVAIDALVDNVVINGVDVTAYVNERDPWYPLRSMLRPETPTAMSAAWAAMQSAWDDTLHRAGALTEDALQRSVNDEFSFVQTIRHLIFAMDKWFTVPVLAAPFHPFGLPNTGSLEHPFPGLQLDSSPSAAEVLTVRAERSERMRSYLATVTPDDLTRTIEVMENGSVPLAEGIFTVLEEEFWHNRYARRDLALLEAGD